MSPLVETGNKGMRHSNDAASYDEDEAAAVCLLFRPRNSGLLLQKAGRCANETAGGRAN